MWWEINLLAFFVTRSRDQLTTSNSSTAERRWTAWKRLIELFLHRSLRVYANKKQALLLHCAGLDYFDDQARIAFVSETSEQETYLLDKHFS